MSETSLEYGKCLLCAKRPARCLPWSRCISIYVCAEYLCFLSFPCGSTLISLHSTQQTFIEPLLCAGNSPDSLLCLFLHHINVTALLEVKAVSKRKYVNQRHLLVFKEIIKKVFFFITGVYRNIP